MIRSAARSAMAITGAFVLPRGTAGITDASTTRSPSTPRTRSWGSTTLVSRRAAGPASAPIAQLPTGWNSVPSSRRMYSRSSTSVITSGPGASSALQIRAMARAPAISLAAWMPRTSGSMSAPSDR
jgi:hypothetical protein